MIKIKYIIGIYLFLTHSCQIGQKVMELKCYF